MIENTAETLKMNWLEKVFHLTEKKTSVKTEFLAGVTTFFALAYIIFINPNILADAGIPKEAAIAPHLLPEHFQQ